MAKIALQSTKALLFPPMYSGTVTMEIDLIQNKPAEEVYELRILDTCTVEAEEDNPEYLALPEEAREGSEIPAKIKLTKQLGETQVRLRRYSYEQIRQLAMALNVPHGEDGVHWINEVFRQGFLTLTNMECQEAKQKGGKGIYFSELGDWKILPV